MRKNKIFILVVLAFVVLSLTQCSNILRFVGSVYTDAKRESKELPVSGTYFCNTLDVWLQFSGHEIAVILPDGRSVRAERTQDYHILSDDGTFYARYRWDQKKEIIFLTITMGMEQISDFDEKQQYEFLLTN